MLLSKISYTVTVLNIAPDAHWFAYQLAYGGHVVMVFMLGMPQQQLHLSSLV